MLKPCKIILADEPTGTVDDKNKEIIMDLFERLKNEGKTIIIVTHDSLLKQRNYHVVSL